MSEVDERVLDRLIVKASEVGTLLNLIDDDDERDRLEGVFERELNAHLYAGSKRRHPDIVTDLLPMPLAPVIPLFGSRN